MLASCLTYSSTLKMEVVMSLETSVDFQRATRRYERTMKSTPVFEARNYTKHQGLAINVAPTSDVLCR
jgi:hypothetical protein